MNNKSTPQVLKELGFKHHNYLEEEFWWSLEIHSDLDITHIEDNDFFSLDVYDSSGDFTVATIRPKKVEDLKLFISMLKGE
jgi:hypothetical protein